MTGIRRGRPPKAPAEHRQKISLSVPGPLFDLLERFKLYPGEARSDVVKRLIIEEAQRREIATAS